VTKGEILNWTVIVGARTRYALLRRDGEMFASKLDCGSLIFDKMKKKICCVLVGFMNGYFLCTK